MIHVMILVKILHLQCHESKNILVHFAKFPAAFDVFPPIYAKCKAANIEKARQIIVDRNGSSHIKTEALFFEFDALILVGFTKVTVVIKKNAVLPWIDSTCWLTADKSRLQA